MLSFDFVATILLKIKLFWALKKRKSFLYNENGKSKRSGTFNKKNI